MPVLAQRDVTDVILAERQTILSCVRTSFVSPFHDSHHTGDSIHQSRHYPPVHCLEIKYQYFRSISVLPTMEAECPVQRSPCTRPPPWRAPGQSDRVLINSGHLTPSNEDILSGRCQGLLELRQNRRKEMIFPKSGNRISSVK